MAREHATEDEYAAVGRAEKAKKLECSVSDEEGLQLQRGRNLFQAIALLIFAGIGAVVGYFLTDDRPDIAALVGGVVGAVVGSFLSGFVLMLKPSTACVKRPLRPVTSGIT